MAHALPFTARLLTLALVACGAQAGNLSATELRTSKAQIDATHTTEKAACSTRSGNAKDVCLEEAKAKDRVAQAELKHRDSGSADDAHKLSVAQAESAYAVAKEKCDDWSGNAKDVCVKEAKAIEVKALADAKLRMQVGDARKDAAADKREADLKVAIEKCDAMSGDAKTSCVNSAQARFGKV